MTLHWWHHWFWITGQATVVLVLLVALPRCLCDQPGGFHGSPGSRRLLGFAERDPAPLQPLAYLTTAPIPPMTPDREPKAIGLAPPPHSSAPSSPPPASSPSAVVEIVEEVEEEVKNANGTHTEEETVVAAAELGVTTPATLSEESPSPSSDPAPFNASVVPQGDTSEEMLNDEPAQPATTERPMSPSPMTPVLGGSDKTSESPPSHPSSASPLILPTTPATARPLTAPLDEPVHPAVDLNTTPVPVPVTSPISNSSSGNSDRSSTSTGTTTTTTMNPTTTATAIPVTALPAHHHEVHHEDRAAAVAPLGAARPHRGALGSSTGLDAGSITGIVLGIVVFAGLVGTISFVLYRRRYLNKPQTLNDKCSNPDSSGYIDDSTLRENSEEMYSLDNDSFLNSLEAMTIQNYWTDSVKHTKL